MSFLNIINILSNPFIFPQINNNMSLRAGRSMNPIDLSHSKNRRGNLYCLHDFTISPWLSYNQLHHRILVRNSLTFGQNIGQVPKISRHCEAQVFFLRCGNLLFMDLHWLVLIKIWTPRSVPWLIQFLNDESKIPHTVLARS